MNIWFLSFADSRLKGPLKRIRRQARAFGFAEERTLIWTEHDLDPDFREKMKDHLIPGSRGYGYWCWKPQIVLQALDRMSDGDILLYADAGCHLNPKGQKRFEEYVRMANEHGLLAFQSRSPKGTAEPDPRYHFLPEGQWTKGDLLDHFGVRNNTPILTTGQIGATVIVMAKQPRIVDLFRRFRSVFLDHFELCDDSPSRSPNLLGFQENRHDQSVFSILLKLENRFPTLSSDEYTPCRSFASAEYRNDASWGASSFSELADKPIFAKHDKGGWRSLIPYSAKRLIFKVLDALKR